MKRAFTIHVWTASHSLIRKYPYLHPSILPHSAQKLPSHTAAKSWWSRCWVCSFVARAHRGGERARVRVVSSSFDTPADRPWTKRILIYQPVVLPMLKMKERLRVYLIFMRSPPKVPPLLVSRLFMRREWPLTHLFNSLSITQAIYVFFRCQAGQTHSSHSSAEYCQPWQPPKESRHEPTNAQQHKG